MKPWLQGPQNLHVKRFTPEMFKKVVEPWITTYVETGTFWGYQLRFAADAFERVIGIEIDEECVERSREWCKDKPNVQVIHGDTQDVLPRLTLDITDPCFFYLDAHYCDHPDQLLHPSQFPLWSELEYILDRGQADMVFIDDFHEFGKGYPGAEEWSTVTVESIEKMLQPKKWQIVRDGMLVWL